MTLEGAQGQTAPEGPRRRAGRRPALEAGRLSRRLCGLAAVPAAQHRGTAAPPRLPGFSPPGTADRQQSTAKGRLNNLNDRPRTQAWGVGRATGATINQLQEQVDEYELAPRGWVDQAQPVERDFATQLARSPIEAADFQHRFPAEPQRINRWVEAKTRDRIKDLIPNVEDAVAADDPGQCRLFQGPASALFQADATRPEPSPQADGSKAQRPSMYRRFTRRLCGLPGGRQLFRAPDMVNQGGHGCHFRRRRLSGPPSRRTRGTNWPWSVHAAQSTGIRPPCRRS